MSQIGYVKQWEPVTGCFGAVNNEVCVSASIEWLIRWELAEGQRFGLSDDKFNESEKGLNNFQTKFDVPDRTYNNVLAKMRESSGLMHVAQRLRVQFFEPRGDGQRKVQFIRDQLEAGEPCVSPFRWELNLDNIFHSMPVVGIFDTQMVLLTLDHARTVTHEIQKVVQSQEKEGGNEVLYLV